MDPEGHFIDAFGRSFPKACALNFMEALTDARRTLQADVSAKIQNYIEEWKGGKRWATVTEVTA